MTGSLIKNTFREIIHTKARFISIMAIIALGVGFFAGIKATSPSMYDLAENYYRDKDLMDFRIVSTTGFSESDVKAIAELDGVKSVMPSYFCDVITSPEDGGDVVRLIAVPKAYGGNKALNSIVIRDGKNARHSGEVVTESVAFVKDSHRTGKTVTFAPMAGKQKLSDILKRDTFTVSGMAESPLYISYQRGTTTIGDGRIDEYMYIPAEDFKTERYTEVYVKCDYSDEVSAFSQEYEDKTEDFKKSLEKLGGERKFSLADDLKAAREKYNKEKAEAEKKLAEGLKELTDGEKEFDTKISEAEAKLAAAKEQIDSGEAQLAAGRAQYESGVTSGQAMLSTGSEQLSAAKEEYARAKSEFEAQIASARAASGAVQTEIDVMEAIGQAQLGAALSQIYSGQAQLAVGQGELLSNLFGAEEKLEAAEKQLEAAKQQYDEGKRAFEEEKAKGSAELEAARKEYASAKAEADEKLTAAQKQLEDGEAKAAELGAAKWYIFTRNDNPGYYTFSQNADRLDAVASVFPLFFLLVAVLVCVTTMTRLIEEKRTEIATLKALGYGNLSIILKYVIYSGIAAVAGGVIGVLLGLATLPFIIYDAYKIMFYIGDITLIPHIPSIALGLLAAALCTTAVSVIVCAKSLKAKPAQGMRPKAPKPGKRILLERITPVWKHMGFTAKLTARNLFRYKVRLCMTVIGVAGCTALIVAAFGLKDSFEPLTKTQFDEIFKYDAVVIPNGAGSAGELSYLAEMCAGTGKVSAGMLSLQEDVTLEANGHKVDESTYLSVPNDVEHLDSLVSLRTRGSKTELKLDNDGVMVNEKLASDFGISVGDTVKLSTEKGSAEVKVGGIYEQYIHNYIFMTPDCYKSLFGRDVRYNMYQVRLTDSSDATDEAFSSALLKDERITAVAFMDENIEDFRNMLSSLDMVVVVMIVCAAALAFVVLYNLTNINIAERVREIATFKVLGFYNRETSRFIYIENIVLTLLGIGVGLWLGVWLSGFIIRTVEVDNVMFGRDIYLKSFLFAAGLTFAFSLLVNFAMSFKIRKVNMVESLKSVE